MFTLRVVFFFFFLFIFINVSRSDYHGKRNLRLVVTIFRHGDRTPDKETLYPRDPHINRTYYPFGSGELTNTGKQRVYNLGQVFKNMYGSFLGPLYLPGLIEPVSTNIARTKCSLELFLASLFSPTGTVLDWNSNINWNPIPYKYLVIEENREISFPLYYCPKYAMLYEAFRRSPEGLAIEKKYKPLYPYITKKSGLNVTSIIHLYELYFGITAEREWGLKLPKWTNRVYPGYMMNAICDNYKLFTATSALNKLFGGFLLKKTINDMHKTLKGSDQPKMYVYSAHEVTVVSMLAALNVFYPHIPDYSACLILELYTIREKHYVKIRYNRYVFNEFVYMKIPGCRTTCPLEQFINLVKENIPEDGDPCAINDADNFLTK